MVKYYCDICGKEVDYNKDPHFRIVEEDRTIDIENTPFDVRFTEYLVCPECISRFKSIFEKEPSYDRHYTLRDTRLYR